MELWKEPSNLANHHIVLFLCIGNSARSITAKPKMYYVFTVCDNAAVEGTDDEKRAAFAQIVRQMRHRVQLFLSLPIETLDSLSVENKMRALGQLPL